MKRIARTSVALGMATALTMGMAACSPQGGEASADDAETIVVGTSALVRPYTYIGDDDELTGYDIELLRLIDDRLDGYEFDFRTSDFPALFPGLDSGRFQVVANNLSATEERREKYDFSVPYIEAVFGIVQLDGDQVGRITDLSDLAGRTTYATPGLNYTRILEEYNEANPDEAVELVYTDLELQQQFQGLAAGTVDFIFSEEVVYQGYGVEGGLDVTFEALDSDSLVETYGTNLYSAYAFSRATDQSDLIAQVDEALQELLDDGTASALSEEFFNGLDVTPTP